MQLGGGLRATAHRLALARCVSNGRVRPTPAGLLWQCNELAASGTLHWGHIASVDQLCTIVKALPHLPQPDAGVSREALPRSVSELTAALAAAPPDSTQHVHALVRLIKALRTIPRLSSTLHEPCTALADATASALLLLPLQSLRAHQLASCFATYAALATTTQKPPRSLHKLALGVQTELVLRERAAAPVDEEDRACPVRDGWVRWDDCVGNALGVGSLRPAELAMLLSSLAKLPVSDRMPFGTLFTLVLRTVTSRAEHAVLLGESVLEDASLIAGPSLPASDAQALVDLTSVRALASNLSSMRRVTLASTEPSSRVQSAIAVAFQALTRLTEKVFALEDVPLRSGEDPTANALHEIHPDTTSSVLVAISHALKQGLVDPDSAFAASNTVLQRSMQPCIPPAELAGLLNSLGIMMRLRDNGTDGLCLSEFRDDSVPHPLLDTVLQHVTPLLHKSIPAALSSPALDFPRFEASVLGAVGAIHNAGASDAWLASVVAPLVMFRLSHPQPSEPQLHHLLMSAWTLAALLQIHTRREPICAVTHLHIAIDEQVSASLQLCRQLLAAQHYNSKQLLAVVSIASRWVEAADSIAAHAPVEALSALRNTAVQLWRMALARLDRQVLQGGQTAEVVQKQVSYKDIAGIAYCVRALDTRSPCLKDALIARETEDLTARLLAAFLLPPLGTPSNGSPAWEAALQAAGMMPHGTVTTSLPPLQLAERSRYPCIALNGVSVAADLLRQAREHPLPLQRAWQPASFDSDDTSVSTRPTRTQVFHSRVLFTALQRDPSASLREAVMATLHARAHNASHGPAFALIAEKATNALNTAQQDPQTLELATSILRELTAANCLPLGLARAVARSMIADCDQRQPSASPQVLTRAIETLCHIVPADPPLLQRALNHCYARFAMSPHPSAPLPARAALTRAIATNPHLSPLPALEWLGDAVASQPSSAQTAQNHVGAALFRLAQRAATDSTLAGDDVLRLLCLSSSQATGLLQNVVRSLSEPSELEMEVLAAVKRSPAFSAEQVLSDEILPLVGILGMCVRPDIVLPSRRIVIEVDGPSHFLPATDPVLWGMDPYSTYAIPSVAETQTGILFGPSPGGTLPLTREDIVHRALDISLVESPATTLRNRAIEASGYSLVSLSFQRIIRALTNGHHNLAKLIQDEVHQCSDD
jgi:hypothetical protein